MLLSPGACGHAGYVISLWHKQPWWHLFGRWVQGFCCIPVAKHLVLAGSAPCSAGWDAPFEVSLSWTLAHHMPPIPTMETWFHPPWKICNPWPNVLGSCTWNNDGSLPPWVDWPPRLPIAVTLAGLFPPGAPSSPPYAQLQLDWQDCQPVGRSAVVPVPWW